jgi:aspartokinase-like uncharacterized kinase
MSASKEDGVEMSNEEAKEACVDALLPEFKKNCDMTMSIIAFENVERLKH